MQQMKNNQINNEIICLDLEIDIDICNITIRLHKDTHTMLHLSIYSCKSLTCRLKGSKDSSIRWTNIFLKANSEKIHPMSKYYIYIYT